MYIKLTRFDNTPVWINAAFVVTVEPRRQASGSIVVPIGDGLDYEVRESPEQVLAMLEGAPVAPVVPVPPPKSLTKAPGDVSAEPMTMTAADVLAVSDIERVKEKPAAKIPVPASAKPTIVVKVSAAEAPSEKAAAEAVVEPAAAEAPKTGAAVSENDVFASPSTLPAEPEFTAPAVEVGADKESAAHKKTAKKPVRKPRAKKSDAVITDEQIERLRKMAPGSVKKLANTITSQLKIDDPGSYIEELAKHGVLTLDHDHVIWN